MTKVTVSQQISWNDLIYEAWRRAREDPDRVDPNAVSQELCQYHRGPGNAGCIIGQALGNLGIPNELREALDGIGGGIGDEEITAVLGLDWGSTPDLLERLQQQQDSGASWGEAWRAAVRKDPMSFRQMLRDKGIDKETAERLGP